MYTGKLSLRITLTVVPLRFYLGNHASTPFWPKYLDCGDGVQGCNLPSISQFTSIYQPLLQYCSIVQLFTRLPNGIAAPIFHVSQRVALQSLSSFVYPLFTSIVQLFTRLPNGIATPFFTFPNEWHCNLCPLLFTHCLQVLFSCLPVYPSYKS